MASAGFVCKPCDETFESRTDLAAHLDDVHVNDDLTCFLCDKRVSSRSNVSRHLREVHYGIGPPKNLR